MNQTIFEEIKKVNEYGQEFWSARELANVLEYSDYRNFESVIKKAKISCKQSGYNIKDHFGDITEMVPIGSGAVRKLSNVKMSRYACFLSMQNADLSKKIPEDKNILDHMGSEELAANIFRVSQTNAKIKRESILGQDEASVAHHEVGKKVRKTIKELGGTMPEKLPVADHVKDAKKRLKSSN